MGDPPKTRRRLKGENESAVYSLLLVKKSNDNGKTDNTRKVTDITKKKSPTDIEKLTIKGVSHRNDVLLNDYSVLMG